MKCSKLAVLTLVLLSTLNINAEYFYKINLDTLENQINITNDINSGNSGSNPIGNVNTQNNNTQENINIWANYLLNNVSPYKAGVLFYFQVLVIQIVI